MEEVVLMSTLRLFFVLLSLVTLVSTASATEPAATGVDPAAPCYACPSTDFDGDGVFDRVDNCNNTPKGCAVDKYGCSIDSDGDGVCDGLDTCPDTPKGEKVNRAGCGASQCAGASAPAAVAAPAETPGVDPAAPCCPAGDYDGDGVFDRLDYCNNTPRGCLVDKAGCSIDSDGDGICDGLDRCPGTPKGEDVNGAGCSASQCAVATVPSTPPPPPPAQEIPRPVTPPPAPTPPQSEVEKQLVETGSIVLRDVYFEFDKANLLPESESRLNEAGAALEKFADLKVEVQGHTDSRGTAKYNEKLSQARAASVRDYLLAHFHLAADNYVAKGYGESQLEISPEKSDADYAMNRRVVLRAINAEVLPKGVTIEQQAK
jgi:OmpA-OmpF porin, OOP family